MNLAGELMRSETVDLYGVKVMPHELETSERARNAPW